MTKPIGNKDAWARLMRLAETGRVPNALLFAGPDGVGKRSFAIEFARRLLCANAGCGECSVCSRVATFDIPNAEKGEERDKVFLSGHPDVGVVLPFKRNLRVGAIRELEREAHLRPYEAARRIFVIDEAEKMNDAASNALLKTLEEPPSTTQLILIASRPDSLLPTILSRCQIIRFTPVDADEIEQYLRSKGQLSPEDASLAARASLGSVGRALSMDIGQFRETRRRMLEALRSAILSGNVSFLLQASEQLSDPKNKDRFEENIGILQGLIRDLLVITAGSGRAELINSDVSDELSEAAEAAYPSQLSRWLLDIEDLLAALNVNVNRKVATDSLFVQMAA